MDTKYSFNLESSMTANKLKGNYSIATTTTTKQNENFHFLFFRDILPIKQINQSLLTLRTENKYIGWSTKSFGIEYIILVDNNNHFVVISFVHRKWTHFFIGNRLIYNQMLKFIPNVHTQNWSNGLLNNHGINIIRHRH